MSHYQAGVNDWSTGTDAFGVCLRETDAFPIWEPEATCEQDTSGPHWQGIPTRSDAASEVARGLTPGTWGAAFQFGLRTKPNQPPGTISAGVAFIVVAPIV